LLEIYLPVLGEETGERRFLCEGAAYVVFGLEFIDLVWISKRDIWYMEAHTFHLSISSVSHGFGFLYVEGMVPTRTEA
jgi:hypothetical protein